MPNDTITGDDPETPDALSAPALPPAAVLAQLISDAIRDGHGRFITALQRPMAAMEVSTNASN